jgi:hypothetical protein
MTNENDARTTLTVSSQEQSTILSKISKAPSNVILPGTPDKQVTRHEAKTVGKQVVVIEDNCQTVAAAEISPGLFVPEQTPSELDSDLEEIAPPTSSVRPRHVPASPADSVMTESSPLARWERRKLPLDRLAAIAPDKQTSSVDVRGTTSQGSHEDMARPTCGPLPQRLSGPVGAPWTPTSTSRKIPTNPKPNSDEISSKRPRSTSMTIDHDRPKKYHRGERGVSTSSEGSSQPIQRFLSNSNEVTQLQPPSLANLERIPQIQQQSSTTSTIEFPLSPLRTSSNSGISSRSLPSWYSRLEGTKASYTEQHQTQIEKRANAALRSLKECIDTACSSFPEDSSKVHDDAVSAVRVCLHQLLAFHTVNPRMLYEHRLLHDGAGIRLLTDRTPPDSIEWPFDIIADAREIHRRWWKEQFDPSMFRGIVLGKTRNPSTTHDHSADKPDPNWSKKFKVKGGNSGPNGLLNGQWWPTQLAAVRDSAHGSSVKYITHSPEHGAVSCILHGGPDFSNNVDNGDEVLLGTSGTYDGKSLPGRTLAMLRRCEIGEPVRLLRSSSIISKYAPKAGLRYDGLYKVVEVETRPLPLDSEQHFRFRLERCPGQDPIRYQAPHVRPTQQELDAYAKSKRTVRFGLEPEEAK